MFKEEKMVCPICGNQVQNGTAVCPYCNAQMSDFQQQSYAQQQPYVQQQPYAQQQTYTQQPYAQQQPYTQQPYAQVSSAAMPYNIPTHMASAIAATLCCCLPFGIVAIIYASKVSTLINMGRLPEAMDASKKANMWVWIAAGCGIILNGLWILGTILEESGY